MMTRRLDTATDGANLSKQLDRLPPGIKRSRHIHRFATILNSSAMACSFKIDHKPSISIGELETTPSTKMIVDENNFLINAQSLI